MCYARWSSEQELKKVTTPVSVHSKIEKSGLPMGYDQTNLFINTSESHSLIIGASGSGKTQSIMLPMLKMSIMAGESSFSLTSMMFLWIRRLPITITGICWMSYAACSPQH